MIIPSFMGITINHYKNPYYNNHGDYSHFHPHKDSEIPKQKLLFKMSGVSSRGILVRSHILDAQFIGKMRGNPLGWRDPARCLTPPLKPFTRGYGAPRNTHYIRCIWGQCHQCPILREPYRMSLYTRTAPLSFLGDLNVKH